MSASPDEPLVIVVRLVGPCVAARPAEEDASAVLPSGSFALVNESLVKLNDLARLNERGRLDWGRWPE